MTLRSKIPNVQRAIDQAAARTVLKTAMRIRNEAIRLILEGTKSGHTYKRHGVTHKASAPGEAPASDLGRLVQSIRVDHAPNSLVARVVAGTNYAKLLELGTQTMRARPFMAPAARNVMQQGGIPADFSLELKV
jgi:HK97 gp10 family phage protein